MKRLELKNLGVQEMNTTEMSKVEGGGILGDIFLLINDTAKTAGTVVKNTVSFVLTQVGVVLGGL